MDIDLKLLGPYAKVYLEGFKATAKSNEPITKPNRANFGALHKKQNVRFLQDVDSKRTDKRTQMEESRKARRSMKFMTARKSNMAEIAQDLSDKTDDDSTEISAIESMDTSGTSEVTANNKSKLVPENPVKTSTIINNKVAATKLGQNRSNMNMVNNRNLKPVPSSKPLPFSAVSQKDETRREQLLKWKKEKEAADMASRKTQKQPFKVGVVVGAKTGNGSDNLTANTTNKNSKNLLSGSTASISSRNGILAAPRVPLITASKKPLAGTTTTALDIPEGEARRVTRAMAKAVVTNTGSTTVRSTQVMKPAIQKMKTLSIAEKGTVSRPGTAPVSSIVSRQALSSQPTKPSQASSSKPLDIILNKKPVAAQGMTINGIKGNKPVPKVVGESVSKTQSQSTPSDKEKNCPVASTEQKPPEVKAKKKLKPQAIDTTYINYNSQFSNACLTLKSYSTAWITILEQKEEMQEEILGDIHSALGKVKLLLQSKLPQFGQLLYSYLCQETDPRPILPCDLEGWWDVVSIQLEAIDKEFKGLDALRKNKWIKVSAVSPPKPSLQESNRASNGNSGKEAIKPPAPIRRAKPNPVKSQASAALRAFLANQRKIVTNAEKPDNETEEAMDVALPLKEEAVHEETSIGQYLNTPGRTFDGRFFTISSPMAKNTPDMHTPQRVKDRMSTRSNNRSPATSLLRTPSRRLSTTSESSLKRMSFCILGVRQSMGSFNKIGAVPISADDRNQETENE